MNLQSVHAVSIFDRTPATPGFGEPCYIVQVHFSEVQLEIMRARRVNADWAATKIAKSLVSTEMSNIVQGPGSGTQMSHPLADLDRLGTPNIYPDDAGTRVWITKAPPGSVFQKVA